MGKFVQDYAEDNTELFEKIKLNKSGYLKTIDKVFTQYQIPLELKYLAIIESKLKTNARSGVGAVGVWQFMPGTAKTLGLKITAKYDERQQIGKSTVAAAKYLTDLYGYFEDWLLVIAAYNSGPAPVLNAIKKSGSRSFWKLQNFLPKETRLHVKRFIATHYYFEGGGSLVTLGKAEAEKYLKKLELWDKRHCRVRELSGGMKRRLLFARAMVHEPKLLILDEPTAGVDLEIRRTMWDFIREINQQGTTIILTTHYLEEAENLCRNIAIIDHGEIIANTSVTNLLSTLQMESFVLSLENPLENLPHLDGLVLRKIDDKTLEIDVTKSQSLNDVFARLSANNIIVSSLRNKVNRLEEMFMLLTKNGRENAVHDNGSSLDQEIIQPSEGS
jgi:ABC-type multidrug transport system ATPase subunit